MFKSKKAKKIVAVGAALSVMVACALPALAGSDGWTNVELPPWRNPKTLAIAEVSSPSNSEGAAVNVTKLVDTDRMYFDIYQHVGGERVSETCYGGVERTSIPYNYPVARGLKLHLKGGNDEYTNKKAYSWGTCNFG